MVDLSRLMQDAAILDVIDKSADEASRLSAQNSYQAMQIDELTQRAESALADAERKIERLKFHAEAMAVAWEKLDFDDGESEDAMEESVFAYRAEFKE